MKTYFAINLDDFHKNAQEGQTRTQIISIPARNMKKAKSFIKRTYPDHNWSLVPEGYFNRHVVFKQQITKSSA